MSRSAVAPRFGAHDGRAGVEIVDPIESARFALYTRSPVTPEPADPGEFRAPVDAAVVVRTDAVEVPKLGNVLVRTADGVVTDGAAGTDRTLPADAYDVELSTAPMKLYLAVESEVTLRHREDSVVVSFGGETPVRIGARSFHERPAGTVTVADDVESVMRGVSLLGSSLKTTGPERSFPTLRGFPPLLRRGEAFDAPAGIERPDTDVRLVLPADLSAVYPAVPLAHYLGAELVSGGGPRLEAGDVAFALPADQGAYEQRLHRTLRQAFFLDCVVRTEGRYRVDLHERERVESRLDLDLADLYDRPLAARLAAYLEVPWDAIADVVPEWHLTVDVRPAVENVEALPYLAADLGLVRAAKRTTSATVRPQPKALADFYRRGSAGKRSRDGSPGKRSRGGSADRRSGGGPPADRSRSDSQGPGHRSESDDEDGLVDVFKPEPVETVEHAWVGAGYPIGANKLTVGALQRGVEWTPAEDARVSVRVVCNDAEMQAEGAVAERYGLRLRDLLEFDVDVVYDLEADDLAELLATDVDLLHYVGHVDEAGFACADGSLDARTLDEIGVRAFLLNACSSYAQGEALVEKGSLGGVVTLSDVPNGVATDLGLPLARLLNCGFPLRVALAIAQREVLTGSRYVTIGDGGVTLCQSQSGAPTLLRVERVGDDAFAVEFVKYLTRHYGPGSMFSPNLPDLKTRYLGPGTLDTFEVSTAELRRLLDLQIAPVEVDGELRWSDELVVEEL